MVADNLDIPRICARDWWRMYRLEQEDLYMEGAVALVKAARSFDPSKGVPFRPWAFIKVRGHVTDVVRRHIRKERDWEGNFVRYSFLQQENEEGDPLFDLADPYENVEKLVLDKEKIRLLKHIPKREAEAVLRAMRGETANEIGSVMGVSQGRVYQMLINARARLQHHADSV